MESEITIRTTSALKFRSKQMQAVNDFLGTTFFTIVVFMAGALLGTPLWNWTKKFLPWNKD